LADEIRKQVGYSSQIKHITQQHTLAVKLDDKEPTLTVANGK